MRRCVQAATAGGLVRVVTARSPPHPQAVARWLRELASRRTMPAWQTSSPASFGMDPNTGRLLPREALSQDTRGAARESDLLGTPSFASPSSGTSVPKLKGRSRLGLVSQGRPSDTHPEVSPLKAPMVGPLTKAYCWPGDLKLDTAEQECTRSRQAWSTRFVRQ